MKNWTLLALLVLMLMLSTSGFGQTTTRPASDSVTVLFEDYKFIREWAEFGLACDSMLINREQKIIALTQVARLKTDQLEVADKAIRELDKKLNRLRRGRNVWNLVAFSVGGVAIFEGLVLIAKN